MTFLRSGLKCSLVHPKSESSRTMPAVLPRISSSPWLNEVLHGSVWWNMWSARVVQSSGDPLSLVLYLIVRCTREWWPAFRSCARACLLCRPTVFVAAQCLRPATNKGQGEFHRLEVHAPMHNLGGSLRCLSEVLFPCQDHLADPIRLKRELGCGHSGAHLVPVNEPCTGDTRPQTAGEAHQGERVFKRGWAPSSSSCKHPMSLQPLRKPRLSLPRLMLGGTGLALGRRWASATERQHGR